MSIPDETLARWAAWPRPGTPGPWTGGNRELEDIHFGVNVFSCVDAGSTSIYARSAYGSSGADATFIALAPEMREAIDVLVAEVRRLRGNVQRIERVASLPDYRSAARDCLIIARQALRGDA